MFHTESVRLRITSSASISARPFAMAAATLFFVMICRPIAAEQNLLLWLPERYHHDQMEPVLPALDPPVGMMITEPTPTDEALGAALASYVVSVGVMRTLCDNGTISQADVDAIVTGALSSLGRSELVSQAGCHAARALLSGLASDLGVPTTTPS